MNMILIKTRDDTKGEVEEMTKERRNKSRTFGFATSSDPWVCMMGLAGRHKFILPAIWKRLYMSFLLTGSYIAVLSLQNIHLRISLNW